MFQDYSKIIRMCRDEMYSDVHPDDLGSFLLLWACLVRQKFESERASSGGRVQPFKSKGPTSYLRNYCWLNIFRVRVLSSKYLDAIYY